VSKKALGKGLDALIQPDDSLSVAENGVSEIALDLIDSTDDQPRKQFSEDTLIELAGSIRENGVIQPIIIEKTKNRYRIVAGERRYRAAHLAGLDRIPAIVRNYTADDRLQVALIENIQRENLNPMEEAAAYDTLLKQLGLKQDELATRIGKSRSTIANTLRLLKLPHIMQDALVAGTITAGHARAILSVINPAERDGLFSKIVAAGHSVREAEELSDKLNKGKGRRKTEKPEQKVQAAPELREIEQRLLESLGTKVQVKGSITSGRIEVSYFTQEDLERLLDLLAGNSH
jgi:ParB family transcriptional regulator, chromosome partitioning protein